VGLRHRPEAPYLCHRPRRRHGEGVSDLETEATKLAAKDQKSQDEQWLATALEKALRRIRDRNAIPVEKLE
jgi:hypothetical protein